ncbi:hypothetical protein NCS52_01204000 [Fusarium sp. LHS14.1]|nr:hypothetical protein NCS52_01204000 [Fusarium sp. LHS14.1]
MPEPNTTEEMEHRNIPSRFHDGFFSRTWVGNNPTLHQRRQYMRAYLEWRLPHEDMDNQERKLRDLEERKAAMWLINSDVIEISTEQFEWLVDEKFWHTWLSYLGERTPFPWRCPQETDEPTRVSQAFEGWLEAHRREGDLVEVWKALEAESRGVEQRHAPGSEGDVVAQRSSDPARDNESEQLHQLEQQVIQLQQELQRQDEQLLQKDERIRELEERLRQQDDRS